MLIELSNAGRFVAASWSEGVMGHAETRGRLVGLAFISKADSDLSASPVRLSGTGGIPTVQRADCSDRLGRSLPMSRVSVEP